ncbi:MAG: zeta toxin family protein [Acidimicrobiales bacterium]
MTDPVVHLLAGPNGAGKTTLHDKVLGPATRLPFVNADLIAADRWPGDEQRNGRAASIAAAEVRDALIAERQSFITETVFSHSSKVELVSRLLRCGYRIHLHVIIVPLGLTVARVMNRVDNGGHAVPEDKIRERYARLWPLVAQAIALAHEATVYDNSNTARPYRVVAQFISGRPFGTIRWPTWAPSELVPLTT